MKTEGKKQKSVRSAYAIPNGGMPSVALLINVQALLRSLGTSLPVTERSTILVQSLACLAVGCPEAAKIMLEQIKGLRKMVEDISKGRYQG